MKDKIRLGVIGCGLLTRNRHIPGLKLLKDAGLDNFELTAVCDNVDENAQAAAAYGRQYLGRSPAVYNDWQELVSKGEVDAVDVVLPHGLHHIVGISCMEAGLHVLMEKPFTVTVKTGRTLAETADRTGLVLATALCHRRLPGQRAVYWAIHEAQLIGEVRAFFQNYSLWKPPAPAGPKTWRQDRLMGGGSSVIDAGFHFLDTSRYFYGDVEKVYAELRAYKDGQPVVTREGLAGERENTVVAVFTFKSGVIGTWCWSTALPGADTRNCVIYGDQGSIEDTGYSNSAIVFHQFMNGAELRGRDGTYLSMQDLQSRQKRAIGPEGMQRLFPNGVTDIFATEVWDFLRAIEEGGKPEVDGWDGLKTLALAEAIYESSWCGQPVYVEDVLNGVGPNGWQRDLDAYWDQQPIPRLQREAGR